MTLFPPVRITRRAFCTTGRGRHRDFYLAAETAGGTSGQHVHLTPGGQYWITIKADPVNELCTLNVYNPSTRPYTFIGSSSVAMKSPLPLRNIGIGRNDSGTPLGGNRYYAFAMWDGAAAQFPLLPGESRIPLAATGLAGSAASASSINLTWTDNPAPDGGSANAEIAYVVQQSPDNSTWTTLTSSLPANSTGFTATGLAASTQYYFRVFPIQHFWRGCSRPLSAAATTEAAPRGFGRRGRDRRADGAGRSHPRTWPRLPDLLRKRA